MLLRETILDPKKTHAEVIQSEKKKYNQDWLVFTEIGYANYVLDLLAINLKTKEVEVVEVDYMHLTPAEKADDIQKFAKLRIVRIMRPVFRDILNKSLNHLSPNYVQVNAKVYSETLKAISNPVRLAILEYLADETKATYSEVLKSLGFNASREAGRFVYHLKMLIKTELIKNEGTSYVISEKGSRILEFCRNLI